MEGSIGRPGHALFVGICGMIEYMYCCFHHTICLVGSPVRFETLW